VSHMEQRLRRSNAASRNVPILLLREESVGRMVLRMRVNDAALRDVLPMLRREEFVEHTEQKMKRSN
jgi:hypothetical protein